MLSPWVGPSPLWPQLTFPHTLTSILRDPQSHSIPSPWAGLGAAAELGSRGALCLKMPAALASLFPLPSRFPFLPPFGFYAIQSFKIKVLKITLSASPFLGICIGISGVNLVSKLLTSALVSFLFSLPPAPTPQCRTPSTSAESSLLSALGGERGRACVTVFETQSASPQLPPSPPHPRCSSRN